VSWPAPRTSPGVEFALGAKRIAPLWRILSGVVEGDWTDATDMDGAQIAVADYCPDWWPANTRGADPPGPPGPRSRSAPTPGPGAGAPSHPDQRALPLSELAEVNAVYGYSFILTNLEVSTPDKAIAVEHWYRHRTQVENIFRDAKHGAALRHLPSGYPQVNTAWMWGALLAVSIAGWLHQLTATPGPDGQLSGHGVREGQATGRHPATPADPGARPPGPPRQHAYPAPTPGYHLLELVPSPNTRPTGSVLTRPHRPDTLRNPLTRGDTRALGLSPPRKPPREDQQIQAKIHSSANSRNRV
jgi:hypothetical protein